MNEPVDRPHLTDETLSVHLDGELDPARSRAVGEHLAACPGCSARCETLAAASAVLRAAAVAPPSELDARRLLDRALERGRSPRYRTWGARALAAPAIPALAAVVLAVLVATGLLSYDRPSSDTAASRPEFTSGAASGTGVLPADAFLGDLGDLGALADAGSLAFLDQAGTDPAAPKLAPALGDSLAKTATTAATSTSELSGRPALASRSAPDSEVGSERQSSADDTRAVTAPSREASPEEAADILQCAETIEASAQRSSQADDSDSPRAPTWRLQLAATGQLSGSPALLLAFQREGGGLQVFLVRRDDCSIVHFLTSPQKRP